MARLDFSTSVAGFIGFTEDIRGGAELFKPMLVTSWTQYLEYFARRNSNGFTDFDAYLPFSVRGYFLNGGRRCWVMSIGTQLSDISKVTGVLGIFEDEITMICFPDLMRAYEAQILHIEQVHGVMEMMISASEATNRMVVLDPPPDRTRPEAVFDWLNKFGHRFMFSDHINEVAAHLIWGWMLLPPIMLLDLGKPEKKQCNQDQHLSNR